LIHLHFGRTLFGRFFVLKFRQISTKNNRYKFVFLLRAILNFNLL
jgi:uncharacterized protein (UPF0128 family)